MNVRRVVLHFERVMICKVQLAARLSSDMKIKQKAHRAGRKKKFDHFLIIDTRVLSFCLSVNIRFARLHNNYYSMSYISGVFVDAQLAVQSPQ